MDYSNIIVETLHSIQVFETSEGLGYDQKNSYTFMPAPGI
jgi:hypothetical protein